MKSDLDRSNRGDATNIRIYEDTKKDLEEIGKYGDTADTIIRRLIAFYKRYREKINGKNKSP